MEFKQWGGMGLQISLGRNMWLRPELVYLLVLYDIVEFILKCFALVAIVDIINLFFCCRIDIDFFFLLSM